LSMMVSFGRAPSLICVSRGGSRREVKTRRLSTIQFKRSSRAEARITRFQGTLFSRFAIALPLSPHAASNEILPQWFLPLRQADFEVARWFPVPP
jgi:hypothetical protein